MRDSVVMKLSLRPNPLESAMRVRYNLRESATRGDFDCVLIHGIPYEVWEGRDYEPMCRSLAAYAEDRMWEELERAGAPTGFVEVTRGDGTQERRAVRTHYAFIASFGHDISIRDARSMTERLQDGVFGPDRRSISAIHRDTDNLHVHSWNDARRQGPTPWTHGAKVRVVSVTRARELWAEIYGERFGEHLTREYVAKAREKTAARYAYKLYHEAREAALARGERFDAEPPPLPRRRGFSSRLQEEMQREQYGDRAEMGERDASERTWDHESETRGDQRSVALPTPDRARALAFDGGRIDVSARASRDARAGERGAADGERELGRGVEAVGDRDLDAQAPALAARLTVLCETSRAAVDELTSAAAERLTNRATESRADDRGIER